MNTLIASALLALGLTAGYPHAPDMAVERSISEAATSEVSPQGLTWQYNYHENYFYDQVRCDKRGYAMKYYEQVPGMVNWHCHKNPGQAKWSMDVLWTI